MVDTCYLRESETALRKVELRDEKTLGLDDTVEPTGLPSLMEIIIVLTV